MITQSELKEVLDYNPDTGVFTWKKNLSRTAKVGTSAGWKEEGYICIQVKGRAYRANRLAYLYMKGIWPKHIVDHINRVKDDNRWSNLRHATNSQNNINSKKQKNNTSGYVGVSWHNATRKWSARIGYKGKKLHLGVYETIEEAVDVYNKKAIKLYGEFVPRVL
jgi:hypothetical protein